MSTCSVTVMANPRKRSAGRGDDAGNGAVKRLRCEEALALDASGLVEDDDGAAPDPNTPLERDAEVFGARPRKTSDADVPRFCGTRFECYADIRKIGEGTYGTVFAARDRRNGRRVALKRVAWGQSEDGVSSSAMREIGLLRELRHRHIVDLEEVVLARDRQLYMVFEQLDCDLRSFMLEQGPLSSGQVQDFLGQLLRGLAYCHGQRTLHRDLKPQNVLVNKATGTLKIADFGLSRAFMVPARHFTMEVVTLWYRAPEILLGERVYSSAIDIWAVACIYAEMAKHRPLFPATSAIDLIFRIFRSLGTPGEETWPGVEQLPNFQATFPRWPAQKLTHLAPRLAPTGVGLLQAMLTYRPASRITAVEALRHPYFTEAVVSDAESTTC